MTLKMLRAKLNISQAEAAKLVGVSVETWANWERGNSFPDVPKIKNIEKCFDIKYNDIIFYPQITV